ncbi:hypothetical protein YC2023_087343 [Brassica napus]
MESTQTRRLVIESEKKKEEDASFGEKAAWFFLERFLEIFKCAEERKCFF